MFNSQISNNRSALATSSLVLIICALQISARPTEMQDSGKSSQTQVNVPTSSGLLQGVQSDSVYKFLSVPYAEAPTGALRFKRPVELKGRDQSIVVDASKLGKTCPQYRHLTRFISPLLNIDHEHQTSEDCLHLNVYVPTSVGSVEHQSRQLQVSSNGNQLPVIVWIPGEGFDFADARQFDGSTLAQKTQSIVVTVQYRVGVLGFLNAPKLNIQGNMGLHDQLMALRWVKKNIGSFGGNSDQVTLMGRFTGSMSISALVTAPNQQLIRTPSGQLLFNKVAMLSGVAVPDWIIDSNQAERADKLEVKALERGLCALEQVEAGICLSSMTVEQLMSIADYGWRLVVDKELIGDVSPVEAIESGQLAQGLKAVMMGETAMEGTLCLYRHLLESGNTNYAQLIEEDKLSTDDLFDVINYDSQVYFGYNLTRSNPIQATLESFLSDDSQTGNLASAAAEEQQQRLRDRYLNACSSYMVKSHSNRFKRNVVARNHLVNNRMDANQRTVDVFHYELKYKPTFSLAPEYIKTAAHGDDVPLIFGLVYNQPREEMNEADLVATRKMMAYIANFVHSDKLSKSNLSDTDFSPAIGTKRSWSSEGQIDAIELTENELTSDMVHKKQQRNKTGCKSSKQTAATTVESDNQVEPRSNVKSTGDTKTNIRVVLFESPAADDLIAQSMIEVMDQQKNGETEQSGGDKSQHLIDLHLQKRLLNQQSNLYIQSAARKGVSQQQQQQLANQQASTMTLVNESSFITMLVFTSCLVIFALMSVCLGLYLVIYRNLSQGMQKENNMRNFATNSTSSCNICGDDSQGGSMDAVLGAASRKDGRFSNVFAKLRNSSPAAAATTNQHTTANHCSITAAAATTAINQPTPATTATRPDATVINDLTRQRLEADKQQQQQE